MSKKFRYVILFVCCFALLLSACGGTPATTTSSPATAPASTVPSAPETPAKTAINIAAMRGPTSMGLVKLMKDAEEWNATNDYTFTLAGAADEISTAIINGSLDIAAVPVNLAAVLYNKTNGGIKVLALNTLGALYVLEAGDTIQSVEDLKGQTIYSTGKGSTPEYSLNYILAQNGFTEDEVTIEYKSESAEIATLLEQGVAKIAVLPEPYVTTVMAKNDKLRIALSFAEEWEKVSSEGSLVAGAAIVRSEFLEANKEAIDAFLDEYQASVDYTFEYPEETAELIAAYGIIPNATLAAIALPKCNVVFRTGEEMQKDISAYLEVLYEANPQSVGGKLPDAEFYYQR